MSRPIAFNAFAAFIVTIIIGELVGCGERQYRAASRESARGLSQNYAEAQVASEATTPQVKGKLVNFQAAAPNVARKIIYDANVTLVVKDMADTETQIAKLLKQVNGYIAEASVDRRQGEQLTGRWKVRVPVAQFDTFLEAVSKLGVAESRNQTAQDVTEEFVDLEAQIANKKRLEERIVALLKDSSGKIKDVIEVEHELSRVRGEIEQMEGRLRYLTNRTDFTTVSISARVEENYVPPAAPSFSSRIAQAWHLSLDALRVFCEEVVVAIVWVFPWLAVICIVTIPALLVVRKRIAANSRRANGEPTSTAQST
jgi:hypothetical protein